MLSRLRIYLSFVRFSHSVFALPFAFAGALFAARYVPITWRTVSWIVVAMVAARSAAMGFNRLVDARLDALNPRTASREIPRGAMRVPEAVALVIDDEAQQAVMIMRDLIVDGATFCSALDPFTADDALQSLEQLSRLHARSAFLEGADWIRARAAELAKMSYVTPEMLQDLLDGPRGDNLSPRVRSATDLAAAIKALAERDGGGWSLRQLRRTRPGLPWRPRARYSVHPPGPRDGSGGGVLQRSRVRAGRRRAATPSVHGRAHYVRSGSVSGGIIGVAGVTGTPSRRRT